MTVEQTPQPTSPSAPTSVVEQLVGPGKKFATVEDLAKGKIESDAFVPKVTDENRQLREALNQLRTENEKLSARASILDRLNSPSEGPGNPPAQPQSPPVTPAEPMSASEVVSLIQRVKQSEVQSANLAKVDQELMKVFGVEAVAFVRQRAAELNMETAELMNIGAKSPDALFGMLGVQRNPSASGNPVYTGVSRPAGQPNTIRNKSFYDVERKRVGNITFIANRELQLQMHKDAQALGDAFYN